MTFKDKEAQRGWELTVRNNQDPYGEAGVQFAERWANQMESRIVNGERLEDVAEEESDRADIEGITGFLYGCAVSILSKVWVYGEELRVWHNLTTQIENEGEKANAEGTTLNPALLNIGGK